MTSIVLWMAMAWGVDAGYEPAPDGHLEYIIQIEPQLLGSLAAGHDVKSEVPPKLDVRHYRITVGTATLPHIAAPPVGSQPSTTGGDRRRAADQFEEAGRSDEAVDMTTPQIRVGYEATSPTGGQYVIEIDARSLGDLDHSDFTGEIPPGLPVTRFLISTNPGTAPGEKPGRGLRVPIPPNGAAAPAVVGVNPAVVDQDPSPWKDPSTTGTENGLPAGGGPPTLALEPTVPDDVPAGDVAPPPAMPARRTFPEAAPALGDTPPRPFLNESPSRPLAADNVVYDESPAHSKGDERDVEREPTTAHRKSETKEPAPAKEPSAADEKGEPKESAPPKQWLPLTLTLLALFASLGGNVFLGWIAWDSYNRSRADGDRIAGGKASLSA